MKRYVLKKLVAAHREYDAAALVRAITREPELVKAMGITAALFGNKHALLYFDAAARLGGKGVAAVFGGAKGGFDIYIGDIVPGRVHKDVRVFEVAYLYAGVPEENLFETLSKAINAVDAHSNNFAKNLLGGESIIGTAYGKKNIESWN